MKKTIFLTIIRGQLARNFLQNEFYPLLCNKFRLVVFTPAAGDPRFLEEFARPDVKFVYYQEKTHSKVDTIFFGLQKYLIYNTYIGLKLKYGIRGLTKEEDLSIWRYWIITVIFKPLSRIRILRDLVRWLDYHLAQRKEVEEFGRMIEKEKPLLVVSTSPLSAADAALIKAARKKGVETIGIPKSWDNMPKAGFRAKTDLLIVWSEFMVEKAVQFQNYKRERIRIAGIPQFDDYVDKDRLWSRERFCREFGFDPDPRKPIILFCSEGKAIPEDKDFASIIYSFITGGKLCAECQLLLRPHFIYSGDEKKFLHLKGKERVVVDLSNNPSEEFKDHADYSRYHMDRLTNSLYHAAIVITTTSTMVLDGVAFDKPLINLAFDGYDTEREYGKSFIWRYESDYYREIISTRATTVVRSQQELLDAINQYLKDQGVKRDRRAELRRRFCYKVDGHSGKRIAGIVMERAEKYM
jgi:hypothetical protein